MKEKDDSSYTKFEKDRFDHLVELNKNILS